MKYQCLHVAVFSLIFFFFFFFYISMLSAAVETGTVRVKMILVRYATLPLDLLMRGDVSLKIC